MYLFYFDEVKHNPPDQESFWLGGVAVHADDAQPIERRLNEGSNLFFGTEILQRGTEFHGKEIVNGKGSCKHMEIARRAELLSFLLDIISSDEVLRFYVKINPENITVTQSPPDEIAFMYLVEQINSFLDVRSSLGMMIGDYDEPAINGSVVSLSKYKRSGTYWRQSTTVDKLLDTVHFTKSHHSRFIQLADVYLYCRQFYRREQASVWRQRFNEQIKGSGILQSSFCKEWPREPVWYR
ncbi:DUF3800 domain-containing protein [Roseivivax marinus]|uniref:DUF3800 domain-containing protein n=1 Tax=Roseivivax marinus TaxID=1379903 RepID=UPI0009E08333|nr:DUF3800 domain-containing protein [Roseivivax marinus]